jgi:dGTPase
MLEWSKLLSSSRIPKIGSDTSESKPTKEFEYRTEIERDHDRILFSTPVRRLSDKTQVFPLEKNDSVRTRLTHSHEVSNLARSVGTALVHATDVFSAVKEQAVRDVPAMLAAVGLAHDLGNPPFGHQGEKAISSWFIDHFAVVKVDPSWPTAGITPRMELEFTNFEGNAQTLRIVTKLQLLNNGRGLNLTLGTLAALMKYPVGADETNKEVHTIKKYNYFASEDSTVEAIRNETGLKPRIRHPLTFIMEACDDIAYSVLDVEDAVKKGLVSVSDILAWLEHRNDKGTEAERELASEVISRARGDYLKYRGENLSPAEFNDVSMQKLRVYAIAAMVRSVIQQYPRVASQMLAGSYEKELLADTPAGHLRSMLKKFAFEHAYQHRSVLEVELLGYHVIRGLMDILWEAIRATREGRANPYHRYVYGRLSENYRRVAEEKDGNLPIRYRDYQLLTDMVSGMTDSFAVDLYGELRGLRESR